MTMPTLTTAISVITFCWKDDYSVKDADEGFDDDLGDEEPDEASLAQIEADNGDDLFDGE